MKKVVTRAPSFVVILFWHSPFGRQSSRVLPNEKLPQGGSERLSAQQIVPGPSSLGHGW